MKSDKKKGSISLEACVVVPIFMILILFIYSIFIVFTAQNLISHALLQSGQSVSLDPYKTEKIDTGSGLLSLGEFIAKLSEGSDPYFMTNTKWYSKEDDSSLANATISIVTGGFLNPEPEDVTGLSSSAMNDVVRKRFVAYLTGGDETTADQILRSMHVVNGLEGITFTAVVKDDDIYITANYELEYVFSFQGMAKLQVQQSVCSHLWK